MDRELIGSEKWNVGKRQVAVLRVYGGILKSLKRSIFVVDERFLNNLFMEGQEERISALNGSESKILIILFKL